MAARRSAGSETRVMPKEEPPRAGLTNSGNARAPARARAASGSRAQSRSVMVSHGPTSRPAAWKATFMKCLSMPTADASTPQPT